MILNEIKNIKSTRHERHQFGTVMGIAAFILGTFLYWRFGFYGWIYGVGFACITPVFIDKTFGTDTAIVLLPFQKVWMGFAVVMGHIMSTLILSSFFFGVFTTVRAINSVIGKPLLDTAWAPGTRESYWIRRDGAPYDAKQSEKQY